MLAVVMLLTMALSELALADPPPEGAPDSDGSGRAEAVPTGSFELPVEAPDTSIAEPQGRRTRQTPGILVHVLGLESDAAYEHSAALTRALKQVLQRAERWSVADGEHSLEVLKAVVQCPDPSWGDCIGEVAEAEGHHPDIHLIWGKVGIKIFTHKIDGLTESDFISVR